MIKKRFFKTIDECEVSFKIEPEDADSVSLVSEHNGWDPIEMDQLKSGPFKTKERLPLDQQFQFRYLVNGDTWVNDEAADAYVPNEHGSENGLIDTTRPGDA